MNIFNQIVQCYNCIGTLEYKKIFLEDLGNQLSLLQLELKEESDEIPSTE